MSDNKSGFSFVWKIENFSMLPHQLGEKLESPKLKSDTWKKVDFYLFLYPRGEKDKENMALYLCKVQEDLKLKLHFTLAVESTEYSERIQHTIKDQVLMIGKGFPELISLSDIHSKTKHYLPQDTLTLRCEISPAEESSTELNIYHESISASMFLKRHCVSRTCIQVQRRSVMWSIQNLKELIQRPKNIFIQLSSSLKNSPSLKLSLNFNKIASGDDIPISIKQTRLSSEDDRLFVKLKITIFSTHEEYQASKTSSHLFELNISDEWSFPPFISISMLKDDKYLHMDELLLRCEFAFSYKDDVHQCENNYMPYTFETRQKNSGLSTCFENIYASGEFCDIELKAGGETFPYFKLVLCARSSVFRAMFENNMREKESKVVEIEDVDPDTLQRMLTYMHSDVLKEDLLPEDVCKLYRVADKYDLASLKRRCSLLLATTMSLSNMCDLLVLADAHQDSFLMSIACDFISSHSTEVFHSPQWESFMKDDPKLSCYVMHKMWMEMYDI